MIGRGSVNQKKKVRVIGGPCAFHSDPESSLVNVTQPLVPGVHQLINGVIFHDTIRGGRGRELRGG